MRKSLFLILTIFISACSSNVDNNTKVLQNRIDSLETKLVNTYKPGFGEFMVGIQIHHSKLWFAGLNQNWKLADFEMRELKETVENIQKFQKERTESQTIGMIYPALDSINNAIQQNNATLFKSSFTLLTNSCNNCHQSAGFGFNVVKIPENSPFSNQGFKNNDSK